MATSNSGSKKGGKDCPCKGKPMMQGKGLTKKGGKK